MCLMLVYRKFHFRFISSEQTGICQSKPCGKQLAVVLWISGRLVLSLANKMLLVHRINGFHSELSAVLNFSQRGFLLGKKGIPLCEACVVLYYLWWMNWHFIFQLNINDFKVHIVFFVSKAMFYEIYSDYLRLCSRKWTIV